MSESPRIEPCTTCGFRMGEPLARLSASDLCFVSDRRFPGRCVVVLHRHATELFELTPEQRHAFVDDVSTAARAIQATVGAFKMNYEVLGNVDPHLHCHLIPRQRGEPKPKAPAWLHPDPQEEMERAAAEAIKRRIAAHLRASSDSSDSS